MHQGPEVSFAKLRLLKAETLMEQISYNPTSTTFFVAKNSSLKSLPFDINY
ncbi:MAG: hypothetical protein K8H89_02265 [Flavobacteriales bacterium]|nr:hypothetical protein [Flavobacteriales bacterium]